MTRQYSKPTIEEFEVQAAERIAVCTGELIGSDPGTLPPWVEIEEGPIPS